MASGSAEKRLMHAAGSGRDVADALEANPKAIERYWCELERRFGGVYFEPQDASQKARLAASNASRACAARRLSIRWRSV